MKRKWLKTLFWVMMAGASFGGVWMNSKEIEDTLHIMNETKIEFTLPDDGHKGEGLPPLDISKPS